MEPRREPRNETPKGALEATVEVDAGSTRTFQLLIESTDVAVGTVVGRLATSDGELAAVVDVDGRSRCEGEPRLTGLTGAVICLRVNDFPTATTANGDLTLGDGTLALTVNAHHPRYLAGAVATAPRYWAPVGVVVDDLAPDGALEAPSGQGSREGRRGGARGFRRNGCSSRAPISNPANRRRRSNRQPKRSRSFTRMRRTPLMNAIQQFDRFRATTGTTPDIQKARGAVHLPIEMIDMYNAEGNAATHRSAALAARVRRISRIAAQLDEGRAWIDEARPSDKKVAAEQIYARLQRQFEAVSLETDDGALDDLSQLVTDQMKDFIQLPSVPVAAAPGAIDEAPDVRSRAPRRASPVLIGTVVVLAILAIVGLNALLAITLIADNPSFGTVADYAAVIGAYGVGGGASSFITKLHDAVLG